MDPKLNSLSFCCSLGGISGSEISAKFSKLVRV